MPSKTSKPSSSRRGAAPAAKPTKDVAGSSSSIHLPPLDDALPINERRIACIELKGQPIGPRCLSWAPDRSSLSVMCGTLIHIVSPALGTHSSLAPSLNMLRRADDPGAKVISCFRTSLEVEKTANTASYDNSGNTIPLRDCSVAPVGSCTDQWKAASWSLERIGPNESYILAALTVKGTIHLFSASNNALAGPFEQRDLLFQVTNSSERSNIFKSRISAFAWAPGNRLIGGNQAGEVVVWKWESSSGSLELESRRPCTEGPIISLVVDAEKQSDDQSLSVAVGGSGFLRIFNLDTSGRDNASSKEALTSTAMPGMKSRSATSVVWIGSRLLWTFPGFVCWHDPTCDVQGFAALEAGTDSVVDTHSAACDIRRAQHPDGHPLVVITLATGTRYAFPEAYLDGNAALPTSTGAPYRGPGPLAMFKSFALLPVGGIAPVHGEGEDKAELNNLEHQVEAIRGLHGLASSSNDVTAAVPSLGAYVHGADALSLIPYFLVRHSMLTLVLTEPGRKQEGVDDATRLRTFLEEARLEELSWPHLRALMAFHAATPSGEREGTAKAILEALLQAQGRSWGKEEVKGAKMLWLAVWLQKQPGSAKLGCDLSGLISALRWRSIRLRAAVDLQALLQSTDLKRLDKDDEVFVRTLCAFGGWLLKADRVVQPQPHDEADVKAAATLKRLAKEAWEKLCGGEAKAKTAYEAVKDDFEKRKGEAISIGHACEACGGEVPLGLSARPGEALSAYGTCSQGHVWSRCNETHRLLCESRALRCSGCGTKATLVSDFDEERNSGKTTTTTKTAGRGGVAPLLHEVLEGRAKRCRDCGGVWVVL